MRVGLEVLVGLNENDPTRNSTVLELWNSGIAAQPGTKALLCSPNTMYFERVRWVAKRPRPNGRPDDRVSEQESTSSEVLHQHPAPAASAQPGLNPAKRMRVHNAINRGYLSRSQERCRHGPHTDELLNFVARRVDFARQRCRA